MITDYIRRLIEFENESELSNLCTIYTNLPRVFIQHKITLVVNMPLWTNFLSGAMMGIEIYKYRKHTVLALSLVKIWKFSTFNEVLIY